MPELILAGPDPVTVPVVIAIAKGLGYEATTPGPGQIKLERGSLNKTVWLGAMAGKGFHISFTFSYAVDGYGNTWLRFDQDGALGAVKGGAIGYAKSKNAYEEFLAALRHETAQRGMLLGEQ
ncbi:hypothetical protein ET445_06200 [Agromyces protaetiae]|uniref:Uncharacterized protein n=1 Tax=Agromyces protaetiae TaxID=2509455 RepID=A0A4P6FBJ1_9MICO|nr:hypothetical protein [Agromyces protaetiae]QAY72996.1 hypothetical protein ET445_06200 [Agromyces protaetiae]